MNLHTYTTIELVEYMGEEEYDAFWEVFIDIEFKKAKFVPQSFDEPADFDYADVVFCKKAITEIEKALKMGFEYPNGRNSVEAILEDALEEVLDDIGRFNEESNWTRF